MDRNKKTYDLNFFEALDVLFADKKSGKAGYIVGETFAPGVYLTVENDVVVIKQLTDEGYKDIGAYMISSNQYNQKYRKVVAATRKELGLE